MGDFSYQWHLIHVVAKGDQPTSLTGRGMQLFATLMLKPERFFTGEGFVALAFDPASSWNLRVHEEAAFRELIEAVATAEYDRADAIIDNDPWFTDKLEEVQTSCERFSGKHAVEYIDYRVQLPR